MNELDAPETFIPYLLSLPHDVVLCISECVTTTFVSESFKTVYSRGYILDVLPFIWSVTSLFYVLCETSFHYLITSLEPCQAVKQNLSHSFSSISTFNSIRIH